MVGVTIVWWWWRWRSGGGGRNATACACEVRAHMCKFCVGLGIYFDFIYGCCICPTIMLELYVILKLPPLCCSAFKIKTGLTLVNKSSYQHSSTKFWFGTLDLDSGSSENQKCLLFRSNGRNQSTQMNG